MLKVISEYGSDTEGICFVFSNRVFADTLLSIRDEIENVDNCSDIRRKGVIVYLKIQNSVDSVLHFLLKTNLNGLVLKSNH